MLLLNWLLSLLFMLLLPQSLANLFISPLIEMMYKRKQGIFWMACLSGLVRDLLLGTPRFGTLAISSLCSTSLTYQASRIFSLEGPLQFLSLSLLLSTLDYLISIILLFFTTTLPIDHLWSWKSYLILSTLAVSWTFVAYGIEYFMQHVVLRRRFS